MCDLGMCCVCVSLGYVLCTCVCDLGTVAVKKSITFRFRRTIVARLNGIGRTSFKHRLYSFVNLNLRQQVQYRID